MLRGICLKRVRILPEAVELMVKKGLDRETVLRMFSAVQLEGVRGKIDKKVLEQHIQAREVSARHRRS